MRLKKLASLFFACAMIASISVPTFATTPDYHSDECASPYAYACPSCNVGKIVYGTRYSSISSGGSDYCRICDKKGTSIGRTITEYERCSQGCGFSRDTRTTTQHGTRCSSHGDIWD